MDSPEAYRESIPSILRKKDGSRRSLRTKSHPKQQCVSNSSLHTNKFFTHSHLASIVGTEKSTVRETLNFFGLVETLSPVFPSVPQIPAPVLNQHISVLLSA
jgi:DNA-directed RNA polymerase specialized sigma subunit